MGLLNLLSCRKPSFSNERQKGKGPIWQWKW
ncbi:hypothetical protein T09_980 [Trichinella sp. T9]|nr:hypothetical protein T09_980 [Trichinella sp. T9]